MLSRRHTMKKDKKRFCFILTYSSMFHQFSYHSSLFMHTVMYCIYIECIYSQQMVLLYKGQRFLISIVSCYPAKTASINVHMCIWNFLFFLFVALLLKPVRYIIYKGFFFFTVLKLLKLGLILLRTTVL